MCVGFFPTLSNMLRSVEAIEESNIGRKVMLKITLGVHRKDDSDGTWDCSSIRA